MVVYRNFDKFNVLLNKELVIRHLKQCIIQFTILQIKYQFSNSTFNRVKKKC